MENTKPRRVARTLTQQQQRARLERNRRRIAAELPDLAQRDQMRKEARDEQTLSGELRRAIHGSRLSLADLAGKAGIPPLALDEFLTGERTLRSDVLDRLANCLGFQPDV
jgi:transcriptional regulator with XRE-family HTH domain